MQGFSPNRAIGLSTSCLCTVRSNKPLTVDFKRTEAPKEPLRSMIEDKPRLTNASTKALSFVASGFSAHDIACHRHHTTKDGSSSFILPHIGLETESVDPQLNHEPRRCWYLQCRSRHHHCRICYKQWSPLQLEDHPDGLPDTGSTNSRIKANLRQRNIQFRWYSFQN